LQGTRVLLLRHAETSAPDRFHGAESDIGLSAWGSRQAEILGESLKDLGASAVYCSAMRRAIDTAEPIGIACRLVPTIQPALHERRLGPLSGVSREEGWSIYAQSKSRWIDGDIEYSHPGGESYADIRRRVLPILKEIVVAHPGQTIIIVAHGVVIRVILTTLLADYQPGDFDRIAIDFASINDLWFDGETWAARELNKVVASSTSRPVA
jgi:2,3-bisphosphoglycerate-dependent phosphoglycerate mutase